MATTEYTHIETIHESAYNVISRCRRNSDEAPVFVKSLKGDYPSHTAIARLQHEYALMKNLSCPGVPTTLALEKRGRGLALVMLDRGCISLARLLSAGQCDLEMIVRVAISVAG